MSDRGINTHVHVLCKCHVLWNACTSYVLMFGTSKKGDGGAGVGEGVHRSGL